MEETKKVIFGVSDEQYGIDIVKVQGIENPMNVVMIPNAPACIVGIMQLRGDVLPIFSLRRKFNFPDVKNIETCKLIVTTVSETTVGILVDKVEEIAEIPADKMFKAPKIIRDSETAYIEHIANVNGKLVVILNTQGLINSEELEIINEIIETEEQN